MNLQNPLVSVIIPIYNGQDTIEDLVETIKNQSYRNWEVIIVDDGSTDFTHQRCEIIAEKDNRIKLICNSHQGVSVARNTGIESAQGEWITFVDADDMLSSNYLSNLIKPIAEFPSTELVISGYKNVNRNNYEITQKVIYNRQYSTNAVGCFFNNLDVFHFYPFFPYSKLYKTAIIKKHKIFFDEKMSLGEDRVFILQYLSNINNLMVIDSCDYSIMSAINNQSLSSKKRSPYDYYRNFKCSYEALIEFFKKKTLRIIKEYADDFIINKSFAYIIIPFSSIGKHKQFITKDLYNYIKSSNIQLNNIHNKKIKILAYIYLHINPKIVFYFFKLCHNLI